MYWKNCAAEKSGHVKDHTHSSTSATIQEIDSVSYTFIWNRKRHKVGKVTICKEFNDGGLKMLNVCDFDTSLKRTWLKKC